MIALEFASRFSTLVSSLTLVGGTPKFLLDESFPYGLTEGELRLLTRINLLLLPPFINFFSAKGKKIGR